MTFTSATDVAAANGNPEYCDVQGSVATDGDGAGPNTARYEIKLPANWNGKFIFWGVGGLAGSLSPSANAVDLSEALADGYATAVTDTGHISTSGFDGTWALIAPGERNVPKVVDYYYRSTHEVTVAAKQLIDGYYDSEISLSYFDGCSYGGHMGMMEAMRYPDDYDGIISGDPYLDNRTQLWGYKNAKAFIDNYISPSLLPVINAAVEKKCDVRDGVKDGLIQDPLKCAFNPDTLICGRAGHTPPNCLTPAQAEALKIYFKPVTDTEDDLVYPGSSVSDLSASGGFDIWAETTQPTDPTGANPWGTSFSPILWGAAQGFINYFVEEDPAFNLNLDWPETNGVITDQALALFDQGTGIGNADQPNQLSQYLAEGKKLIIYHGLSDPAISPYRTIEFYEDLANETSGYHNLQQQVRLFLEPGMLHCGGGVGPNSFDTLTPLNNWVENGVAPNGIVATHYIDNVQSNGIGRTMPLCMFPEEARYDRHGSVDDAANWTCPRSDKKLLTLGLDGILYSGLEQGGGHPDKGARHRRRRAR